MTSALASRDVRYGGRVKPKNDEPEALSSKPSAGAMIGGLLAGLEHAVTGRPKTPAQVEEQYNEPWASADGLTVEGLEDPIDRPEPPPDRSGATL